MADTLLEQLRRTRSDHAAELEAHRFLIEAYSGGGGFAPTLSPPPSSWWGASALDYGASGTTLWTPGVTTSVKRSWLDRYPREDDPKYAARIAVAHYLNYVEMLTELKCSYMLREPFAVHDQPTEVGEWSKNVDGDETTWSEWLPDVVSMAATLGWAPCLLDSMPVEQGLSRAQVGDNAPTLRPMLPSQLLEWEADGKRFRWAKIRTDHVERESFRTEPVEYERYAIWTPEDVTVFRVVKTKNAEPTVLSEPPRPHGFGRVPIAILRHAPGGDMLRGRPMHWSVAQENKRLFNLDSEIDEHIRSNVFALLVTPEIRSPAPQGGEVDVGAQNGLFFDPEGKHAPHYIAPPASVGATLETRKESTIREIFRIARIEFTRPTGQATSGVAREYEFEQTNRALGDFAKNVARFQLDVDDLVGAAYSVDEAKRRAEQVVPPRTFAIQDLERDLRVAEQTALLGVGPAATKHLKSAVVRRVLPNLTQREYAEIDAELEQAVEAEEQAAALAAEALAGEPKPGEDDTEGDPPEDDAVTDETKKPARAA